MNFLELVQRLVREAGMTGPGPADVASATGEYRRAVDWIRKADLDIQKKNGDWRFMWGALSFQTTIAVGDYTETQVMAGQAAGVMPERFDTDSFRFYPTAVGVAGEQFMLYRDYPYFRDYWRFGNNRIAQGQPLEWTYSPGRMVLLAQIPNDVYTIVGEFYRRPVQLALSNTATPLYPERFHELAVWWALINYAGFEESSATYTNAQNMVNMLLGPMEADERPTITFGGPLA
jgi:hypothetical protein